MEITLLKAKLHQATVTLTELEYEGSCAIDADLLKLSGIREYEQIEELILEAEAERERLEKVVNAPELASNPVKLQKSWTEFDTARQRVDLLYSRWTELEEKKHQAD